VKMSKHYTLKEHNYAHGIPVETVRGYNIIGEPDCRDIYYCGDMWAVVSRCEDEEDTEYFTSLASARDYANQ